MINSGAINGSTINGSASSVTYINATGRGFSSALNIPDLAVSGRGFSTPFPVITIVPNFDYTVTGRGFSTSPGIYGGATISGNSFATTLSSFTQASNEFNVVGRGFSTAFEFNYVANSNGTVSGRGFASSPTILGGAIVLGQGFRSTVESIVTASELITVTGRGFLASLDSYSNAPTSITVTGRGFGSTLFHAVVSGNGFATRAVIQFASASLNTEALVMNLLTSEVSRYTNYPFMHLIKIGKEYYGVKSDGLYLLGGTTDLTSAVTGTVITKDTDFGVFQSKNVPYLYVNGDDTYKVTPIVDGVNKTSQNSQFSGRKIHLGRGSKGRYWAFKIEGIKYLQGVEYLPDQIQRRVK